MSAITLWKDRENKLIDPLLFSQEAEKFAKKLSEKKRKNNKNSQLRRFFDEIVKLNDRAKSSTVEMDTILPYLHMIIAKAAYAKGRDLVCEDFVSLIKDGVEQVKTKEDLRIFTSFFEALIAFYKLYRPRD